MSTFGGVNKNAKAILTINTQVKEYADDDFHAASVGGVLNLLDASAGCTIQNLVIRSTSKTQGVAITYYDSDGEPTSTSNDDCATNVGVGAFAGSTTSMSAISGDAGNTVNFTNVDIQNMTINGPKSAGGLLGIAGKRSGTYDPDASDKYTAKKTAILIQPEKWLYSVGVNITDCTYQDIIVNATEAAGGFVGYLTTETDNVNSSYNVTSGTLTFGSSDGENGGSKIGNIDNSTLYAGGVFGYVDMENYINATDQDSYRAVELKNVKVAAKTFAGGFVGCIKSKKYQLNHATFKGTSANRANVSAIFDNNKGSENYISAGGIVGEAVGSGDYCQINDCKFEMADINNEINFNLNQEGQRNGGIAGYIGDGGAGVTIDSCTVKSANVYGSRSGGIVGGVARKTVITDSTVQGTSDASRSTIKGTKIAGGIIGISSVDSDSSSVRVEGCKVKYMEVSSNEWGTGGLIGDVDYNHSKELYIFNCVVESSQVKTMVAGGTAGGMAGTVRGKMAASNILLSDVSIENAQTYATNKVGILIGVTGDNNVGVISVAGISLQNVTAKTKNNQNVTALYGVAEGNKKTVESNSYFAFADYSGLAASTDKTLLDNVTSTDPYVVTSPLNECVELYNSEADTNPMYLYGDGASWDNTTLKVKAEEILENRKAVTNGHYVYQNTGIGEDEDPLSNLIFTYKTNQPASAIANDFPVLQITGGDTAAITKYLDILTNGGFSAANKLESASHVSVQTRMYEYNDAKKGFVLKTDENNNPVDASLKAVKGSNGWVFSTTSDYDNDKDRFTLLTVTFTEYNEGGKDDGIKHEYKIQIPVIVRRMLEIDFTSTLTYGTDFRSQDYAGLFDHVLERFDNAVTGYLTYTYNSALGQYTDYGWNSYVNAGGNVAQALQKNLVFDQSAAFPNGTQLSLVDGRTNKVYYYEVTEENNKGLVNGKVTIPLTAFCDSTGVSYEGLSIGELMGVTAETASQGSFVEVDAQGKPLANATNKDSYTLPTVKITDSKGTTHYYRKTETGETGTHNISVNEEKLIGQSDESTVSEDYYLVITVPDSGAAATAINGSLKTEISGNGIPLNLNEIRTNQENSTLIKNDYTNNESTYCIVNSYTQELTDPRTAANVLITVNNRNLDIDAVTKIEIPSGQNYRTSDQLYQRFVIGLQNTIDSNTTSESFPNGTYSDAANFYVYSQDENGNKTYYKYEQDSWQITTDGDPIAIPAYGWSAKNGKIELPLSVDGTADNAVSLQELRDTHKLTELYIEVRTSAVLPMTDINVIPAVMAAAGTSPQNFARLTYTSQLSTMRKSLTYSTNRVSQNETNVKYYREDTTSTLLTYGADESDQLGINLFDLRYLDASEQHSLIDTTADYDMSAMKNLSDVLASSSGIRFTLSLLPKNTADGSDLEGYSSENIANAKEEYLDVEVKDVNGKDAIEPDRLNYDAGTWTWEVPKADYWDTDSNMAKTDVLTDGNTLRQRIQLKVNVDNVEKEQHFYSNYKVILTAEILNAEGSAVPNTHQEDNIVYTLAKINLDFVDK